MRDRINYLLNKLDTADDQDPQQQQQVEKKATQGLRFLQLTVCSVFKEPSLFPLEFI